MTNKEKLQSAEFFCGERDYSVKPGFPGRYMVTDLITVDGFAIVGDSLDDLCDEAAQVLGLDD